MKLSTLLFLSLVYLAPVTAQAQTMPSSLQLDHTKATLVTEHSTINSTVFRAGLLLEAKDGWHTYWENPGDAGIPTEMKWTLPEGFTVGATDWQIPSRLLEGPLATFAYPGKVFLPVTITPATLNIDTTYPIHVKAQWLVCKDICIPESAELEVALPATAAKPETSPSAALFAEHDRQAPEKLSATLSYRISDKQLAIVLPLKTLHVSDIASATFFPRELNVFKYAPEQKLTFDDKNAPQLAIEMEAAPTAPLSGILIIKTSQGEKAFEVALSSNVAASGAENTISGFAAILLLAVLGGLVLNLMPCVLPVLSLKALSIAQKAGHKNEHVVRHGIAYTLGILISFAVIAGILIALRHGGQAIGWGYQMQSPGFVAFLIYLLFLVGLNLSGMFLVPVLLGGVGNNLAGESSAHGSFFTGILATAVATPCTAPFMASAIGAALTMPPIQSLLVFEALGLGLALPFLLISIFPRFRRFLPKPGAWMDIFKQVLAFPMYASVIWLMWVLTLQTGASGMVVALTGMLGIIIVLWMKALFASGSKAYGIVSIILYALIVAVSIPMLNTMDGPSSISIPHAEQGVDVVDYSKTKLDELRTAGKPVFVDATAAWCITCQVNARLALHTARTMDIFKKQGITLMIADWTKRNDDITHFLDSFGYKGVPLCVFYPADNGKSIVLPQILTEDAVIATITPKGD